MSSSLQERRRTLVLGRAREQRGGVVVQRFFNGDATAFCWAESATEGERPLSPTWRLWLAEWSAVRQLSELLKARSTVVVHFGSMPEVGGVTVAGGTILSCLEDWIVEDADLIRLCDPAGQWEVSLDIYEPARPRIALMVAGERWLDLPALGDGTEPWLWGFLPATLNESVEALKHLVLGDEAVDADRLGSQLATFGMMILGIEQRGPQASGRLTIATSEEPQAQRAFDDLRRALVAELPDLVVEGGST